MGSCGIEGSAGSSGIEGVCVGSAGFVTNFLKFDKILLKVVQSSYLTLGNSGPCKV